jgi:hypothetical protein
MLIFHCNDCDKTITSDDRERPSEIVDRIESHLTVCPLATFTYAGTTDVARQKANNLRSLIVEAHLTSQERLY